jgi:RNA-binding protein YlmH
MDKKSFLNAINFEDTNLLSNLYDKINLSQKISKPIFTSEFYPPNVWKAVSDMNKSFNVNIFTNGVFEDCERRMMCFSIEQPDKYPIILLKIDNKSKFEKLEHRNYLGAIMALGIKREKYGDLIIEDDSCYIAVSEEISDYILNNLSSIGRCPCKIKTVYNYNEQVIRAKFENMVINSTSMRLDCVVSSLCNISRAKAVDIISGGKVLVDYIEMHEKDRLLDTDIVITIRGYGKFKIVEQLGSSQRGRIKLSMKKYI